MKTNFYNFIKKNDEIEIVCPSCGQKNPFSKNLCSSCSFDLIETKGQLYSHYHYFNASLEFIEKQDLLSSFDNICRYMAYEENDENAYKIYIYLLVKLGGLEKAKLELETFEKKFPRNPWLMIVETDGIDNIVLPQISKKKIGFNLLENQLNSLYTDYVNNRIRNVNELSSMVYNFYEILSANRTNFEARKQLQAYLEKVIIPVLSRREIRLEIFEEQNVDELTDEQMQEIDIKGTIEHKLYPSGTIITLSPGIYVRSMLLNKQQILVVSNTEKTKKKNKKSKEK